MKETCKKKCLTQFEIHTKCFPSALSTFFAVGLPGVRSLWVGFKFVFMNCSVGITFSMSSESGLTPPLCVSGLRDLEMLAFSLFFSALHFPFFS